MGTFMTRKINPSLFARLMCLPDATRADLLEFLGATPVGETHLSEILDTIAARLAGETRRAKAEAA